MPNLAPNLRLMFANPQKLDQGEIGERRITCKVQEAAFTDSAIEPLALFLTPLIAPDDGWPQDLTVLVEDDCPVHLAGESDAGDLLGLNAALRKHGPDRLLASFPPIRWILLSPSRSFGCESTVVRSRGSDQRTVIRHHNGAGPACADVNA